MKIVCGSCQAKYSIADEKVAGKVFKIRCKRCGEVIVVRGDQEGAVPPGNSNGHEHEAEGDEAVSDAIWHVVINGEQAGPYTPGQLGEMISNGQLDWEAYVWSEGFENWLPMRDVPQLVAALTSGQSEGEEATSSSQPLQQVAAQQPSMGADPFAEEAPVMYAKVAGDAVGGRSVGHSGGGGHAVVSRSSSSAAGSGFDTSPKVAVSAPSPRVTSEQAALTGVRNENSVLFSLKNLQALATGSGAPSAGASNRPGFAGGEGSGLIDIRALATTTGVQEPNRNSTEKDALLSLGSAQAGAFGALGSPMLTAPGKSDDDEGKKGLMFAIVGGFALLAVAGIAIAFIMKPSEQATAVIAPIAAPPTAATVGAAQTEPKTPPPSAATPTAEPPSEGELAAQRAATAAAAAAEPADEGKHAKPAKHASSHDDRPSAAAAPVAAKSEPAAKPEKSEKPVRKGGGSIDDLLDSAIGGKGNAAGAKREAAAAANLPEKPSRDDVLSAMKGVTDAVKACGKGQTGTAIANVTVAGKTGRVNNVEVSGMTGEVGSCIARSVRKASFPKFSSESFQVKYPFRI